MHINIIFAHPGRDSFCRAALDALIAGLQESEHTFEVSDLYALKFSPLLDRATYESERIDGDVATTVPDVIEQHERIRRADAMAFVFPLWWSDVPAILKGWFDRVWVRGFAYSPSGDTELHRLALQKAVVLCTAGHSQEQLEQDGVIASLHSAMIGDRLMNVGFRSAELVLLAGLVTADDATRRALLERSRAAGTAF